MKFYLHTIMLSCSIITIALHAHVPEQVNTNPVTAPVTTTKVIPAEVIIQWGKNESKIARLQYQNRRLRILTAMSLLTAAGAITYHIHQNIIDAYLKIGKQTINENYQAAWLASAQHIRAARTWLSDALKPAADAKVSTENQPAAQLPTAQSSK